jgi:transglutaminase-like putative cysteine protease
LWWIAAALGLFAILLVVGVTAYAGVLDIWAPTASLRTVYAIQGEQLFAKDFVEAVYDGTLRLPWRDGASLEERGLRPATLLEEGGEPPAASATDGVPWVLASFAAPPDLTEASRQSVAVILTDAAGNSSRHSAELIVVPGSVERDIEAGGDAAEITASLFANMPAGTTADLITSPEALDLNVADRTYELQLDMEGRVSFCKLHVRDSTPPSAQVTELATMLGELPDPMNFFTDVRDATDVRADFVRPPDVSAPGRIPVNLRLRDGAGNTAAFTSYVTVKKDVEKPVISGVRNQTVVVGSAVSYRSGVTVSDDCDKNIKLEVDSSAVNLAVAGVYPVVYRAVDASGNEARIVAELVLVELTEAIVYEKADEILSRIIGEGMSPYEKARAIYNWTSTKIRYTGSADKSDVLRGAYNAFGSGKGDCYNFYAAAEVLLTRANIENVGVTRIAGAPTRHYWNLVNLGEGWYHYDTCPAPIRIDKFLFTESRAREYTAKLQHIRKDYYEYDRTAYPEVVQ